MNQTDITYLGGLLHDIGKFAFRAQKTQRGVDHEMLGEEFASEYLTTKFECFKPKGNEIRKALVRGNTFVREADHAAASERIKQESKETRRPLMSIFKYIDIGIGDAPSEVYYLEPKPLKRLNIELNIEITRPVHKRNVTEKSWQPDEEEMIDLHKESWKEFTEELETIYKNGCTDHKQAMLSTLFSLLWKYTSTVSSASYLTNPDISLFDHSRMVAAASVCMSQAEESIDKVILLKGDISGIQNFIYSEIKDTDKASKKLRGRSFFVKLLADTIGNYIIREFNLYDGNIVYNSGGGFEILIPANTENRKKLEELEKRINLSLYEVFRSSLQVVLAWVEASINEIFVEFDEVQRKLGSELRQKKSRKSLSILERIFPETVEEQLSEIKGISFDEIGGAIPHTKYIVEIVSTKEIGFEEKFSRRVVKLPHFCTYWYLADSKEHCKEFIKSIYNQKPEFATIYSIKDTEIAQNADITREFCDIPIALSFKFIARNAPRNQKNNNELLEFSEISELKSKNYPLLGVLRMDVDNLGYIFKKGLKWTQKQEMENKEEKKRYSISRLATLSRQMDMFFTRDVDLLAKEHDIYITYSGGDDLFAVGSWVNIIEFAKKVKENFAEYTTKNPNITLSAGIAITKPTYPIAKSALISGAEESRAKRTAIHREDTEKGKKDKISVFETVVYWKELEDKIKFAKSLNEAIDKNKSSSKGITSSFVYRLLSNVRQTFDKKGELNTEKIYNLTAKLHYLFARRELSEHAINSKDNKDDKEIREIKNTLLRQFLKSEKLERQRWYSTFPIIGNYVVFKNRGKNGK